MIWKSRKVKKSEDSKIVLGMVMLPDDDYFDVNSFINDFNNRYGDKIKKTTGDRTSLVFTVDGEKVAIAHMDFPIPTEDIEDTAEYTYNWQNVLEDTEGQKSHFIVSVYSRRKRPNKTLQNFYAGSLFTPTHNKCNRRLSGKSRSNE